MKRRIELFNNPVGYRTSPIFLTFVILVFSCASVSAQEETWSYDPQNTITFDIGKPAASLLMMGMSTSDYRSYFIASAVQYERQLLPEYWSVAGRLAYTGYFSPYDDSRWSSISVEGHFRYYPDGRSFFLDGMLGYANFAISEADWEIPMSHHFLLGGKFGWRVDFGNPGGLVLDFSMGFYGAFGKTNFDVDSGSGELDAYLDEWLNLLAKFFFAGPRVDLHIGYRF